MENGQKQGTGSQTAVMKQLNQQSAAWLLGCTTRHLRNQSATVPRCEDDSYNAQDLVAWAISNFTPATKLSDETAELLEKICDKHFPVAFWPYVNILDQLTKKLGSVRAAHETIGCRLAEMWQYEYQRQPDRDCCVQPTELELQQNAESSRKHFIADRRHSAFQTRAVCTECKKQRFGKSWRKEPVPSDHVAVDDICGDCRDKSCRGIRR